MSADLSRDSFHSRNHYLQVVLQQGRVLLDADFNEQAAIQLYRLRQLARDLHGPHWGPSPDEFQVRLVKNDGKPDDLQISGGHYYVDGLLCENGDPDDKTYYTSQPDFPSPPPLVKPPYLVYVEVWLRELTAYEAGDAGIASDAFDPLVRDPALGHLDTSLRKRVVWQVKFVSLDATTAAVSDFTAFKAVLTKHGVWRRLRGQLAARVRQRDNQNGTPDRCATDLEFGYRGADNQLFRVEIHDVDPGGKGFWFKWALDNASAVFPAAPFVVERGQKTLTLHLLGSAAGPRPTLRPHDWVELLDDTYSLHVNQPEPVPDYRFLHVRDVDPHEGTVVLDLPQSDVISVGTHPMLRRWRHKPKWVALDNKNWTDLGDGVQVRFDNTPAGKDPNKQQKRSPDPQELPSPRGNRDPNEQPKCNFRRGDYWLIAARTATRDVIWPIGPDGPIPLDPQNPLPAYAPLLLVRTESDSGLDLRRIFNRDASPPDGQTTKPDSKPKPPAPATE